jgi:hypothetical protein
MSSKKLYICHQYVVSSVFMATENFYLALKSGVFCLRHPVQRPALGPTQFPIEWVRGGGSFPGGKAAGA